MSLSDLDSRAYKTGSRGRPVTLCIIGCGQRGKAYATYALQHATECQVVAVAEPRNAIRNLLVAQHSATINPDYVFVSWQEFLKKTVDRNERLCHAVVVAVQDQLHAEVVVALSAFRYDILCEKPMATTVSDCFKIFDTVKSSGIIFGMGHVMRYSPYSKAITEIIESKRLGSLINCVQIEPVGYYHFAHSYVRGNWHSEAESSFTLMTKCCHDIDLLCRWMQPAKPMHISSFGSLSHFRRSEKPAEAGSATKCLECDIQYRCPYSARKVYLERIVQGHTTWPVSPLVDGIPDIENVTAALMNGPYGRCVYEAPNDVVDHQVVALEFSNGATVSFTMAAFTDAICDREVRLNFSHGQIIGDMKEFIVHDFRQPDGDKSRAVLHKPPSEGGGHGGGDAGLMKSFVAAVKNRDQSYLGTSVDEILQSHLTVFAAETARTGKQVVAYAAFEDEMRRKYGTR